MQYEHHTLEPYGVNGSIRAPIPILDNLQDTGGTEASEGLSLLVLPAVLSEEKCKSKEVHHRSRQGKQVPF
jgi:hypothetical protein